jgi:ParB family chromosome partitioning protein
MEQTLQTITLNNIRPNPHNPRKNFAGKSFEELVASVREKGVIQPILVRPVKSKKTPFEIIFGERRFRASCVVAKANGGLAKHEIPVLVRDLDDNTSFDLMTIENLQRQDLTELEEATSFKYYIEKHGEEAAATLAERTGISAGYIRRRVAVLALPKYVLKAWDKGQLKYGHLEQLSRLKDKEQIKRLYEEIIEVADSWSPITVADLKKNIAAESPALAKALFNIKKDGCATCPQNSDVQGNLFETDTTNKKCMHPKCYKEKQAAWFAENRDKFVEKHDLKTNGFRFLDDFEWNAFETIHDWEKTPDNCKECDHLVTMLSVEGEVQRTKACIGPNDCLDKAKKEEKKQAKSKDGKSGPRVAWHGSSRPCTLPSIPYLKPTTRYIPGMRSGMSCAKRRSLTNGLPFLTESFLTTLPPWTRSGSRPICATPPCRSFSRTPMQTITASWSPTISRSTLPASGPLPRNTSRKRPRPRSWIWAGLSKFLMTRKSTPTWWTCSTTRSTVSSVARKANWWTCF